MTGNVNYLLRGGVLLTEARGSVDRVESNHSLALETGRAFNNEDVRRKTHSQGRSFLQGPFPELGRRRGSVPVAPPLADAGGGGGPLGEEVGDGAGAWPRMPRPLPLRSGRGPQRQGCAEGEIQCCQLSLLPWPFSEVSIPPAPTASRRPSSPLSALPS